MNLFKKYYDPIRKKGVLNLFGFIELTKLYNPLKVLRQEINTLQSFINTACDITKLPKANGTLRQHQLECLKLLKMVDLICKKNELKYFLSFGTLLGAKRHEGFIPWDDDVDISMLREDYNKILPILKQEFKNTEYIIRENILSHFQIRVYNKEIPEVGIDIFPMDMYYKSSVEGNKEKQTLNINIKKTMIELGRKYSNSMDKNRKLINKLTKKNIMKNKKPCEKALLFYGIDYPHSHSDIVFTYNSIFPLSTISFEEYIFPCPNNINLHLKQLYGDYMSFPKNSFIDR